MDYRTQGVCCQLIHLELDAEKRLHNVRFTGGCNGNLKGISALVEGMEADAAIARLEGIRCGSKPTSCPDQLSRAIKAALNS